MQPYTRRHRPLASLFEGRRKKPAVDSCDELVLKLDRDELFDRHMLAPHTELNPLIFDRVNHFVERYRGEGMVLTVFCEPLSEATQDSFREEYHAHYEVEYQKVRRYLHRRYVRVGLLLAISVLTYYGGNALKAHMHNFNFLLNVVGNIGVFCLWEIGYTHFDRSDANEEKKRILRARDAEIRFD